MARGGMAPVTLCGREHSVNRMSIAPTSLPTPREPSTTSTRESHMHRSSATLAVALSGLMSFGPISVTEHARRAPEAIASNDNRRSAGTLKAGVLTVQLEARSGTWSPEGAQGVGVQTAAWAERGRPLENPGPAI